MTTETPLVERLRRLYAQNGTNYVQEAADRIEQLERELAEARKDVAHWQRMYECAQNANHYRQSALEGDPLKKYGNHTFDCHHHLGHDCTCGFDAAKGG